jgi:predicted ester cyclase
MTTEANKARIRDLFEQVWTNGDADAVARFYAPGPTLDGLQGFARALYVAFPDWRATIDDLIAEGDSVVVRWTGTGTHRGEWAGVAATGREVRTTGTDIERFVDGLIVEEHGNVDMLGFMEQIGAVTMNGRD